MDIKYSVINTFIQDQDSLGVCLEMNSIKLNSLFHPHRTIQFVTVFQIIYIINNL